MRAAILAMGVTAMSAVDAAAGELPPGRQIPYPAAVAKRLAQPKRINQAPAPIPEGARAAGHLGKVAVKVAYTADGTISEAAVEESSGSPLLDAAALAAARASTVEPGVDASGNRKSGDVRLVYTFDDRSAATYRCDQAVRDWKWRLSTSPATMFYFGDLLFDTLFGDFYATYMLPGRATWPNQVKSWEKAIRQCERTPDALFVPTARSAGVLLFPSAVSERAARKPGQ